LGSFRLQVLGNPNAVNAAICSGRFPGVFTPFPITDIYPASDPDNALLHKLLTGWLNDPQVAAAMAQAYQVDRHPISRKLDGWDLLFASWRDAEDMREFFPRETDAYVDGGAIDNTPSNSAVDYVREWAEEKGLSKRDLELELFVIFLGIEPKLTPSEVQDPNLYQVVKRTLDIMGVAKQSNDTNTVSTINTFGKRGEELGQALKLVLETLQENLGNFNAAQRSQIESQLREKARQLEQRGYLGETADGILERMQHWADEQMAQGVPLHVEEVKIYPEEMPLSTLQFTERLGYRKENAIQMLTMGCYNTLAALRRHLESQKKGDLDSQDQSVLALVQKWMGEAVWPGGSAEQEKFCRDWRCQRETCVFHSRNCKHGAS
jgi:hypothetical protein